MTQQKMNHLEDLFKDVLMDLYDAEQQIVKALPKMAEQAHAEQLKQSFKDHLQVTQGQITRLNDIFKEMKMPAQGKHCKGMEGLIKEGEEVMREEMEEGVKDAALIAAAQKVEHYEISGYGTARSYAKALGYQRIADMLDKTANEEGETDKLLTSIAEGRINRRAKHTNEEQHVTGNG